MEPIEMYSIIQPIVRKEIDDKIATYADKSKFNVAQIPAHYHNGVDSGRIDFGDIENKSLYIPITLIGASAATAANYGVIFIAPFACTLTAVKEAHQTAGTDGGAVTLTLEKLTGTQALGAGVEMMTPLSLKGTADTVVNGVISDVRANVNLAVGDRIALKDAGTLTSVANVSLMIKITF